MENTEQLCRALGQSPQSTAIWVAAVALNDSVTDLYNAQRGGGEGPKGPRTGRFCGAGELASSRVWVGPASLRACPQNAQRCLGMTGQAHYQAVVAAREGYSPWGWVRGQSKGLPRDCPA